MAWDTFWANFSQTHLVTLDEVIFNVLAKPRANSAKKRCHSITNVEQTQEKT
jgi:hypothetical protein